MITAGTIKNRHHWKIIPLMMVLYFNYPSVYSQEIPEKDSTRKAVISYGKNGFEIKSVDNRYAIQIQGRLQFRFATPEDQDPVTYDDFSHQNEKLFKINRARLKVGGNAFQPWLKYFWEYDLAQNILLDFRINIEKYEWLSFVVGQWKIEYNRERRISSGAQEMMDRSVINRPFTIDRQQGVEAYGHLKGNGMADFNYWLAVLTGTGRGSTTNDDSHLMYFGRLQWNLLGRPVDFSGSDLELRPKPAAVIAIAGVTNRSPYTRFSSSGGGSLDGYEDGQPGQYRVNQAQLESAFKFKGFSWQSEVHWKQIIDKLNDDQTDLLWGYYFQGGYFFHQKIEWWPKPLEMAFRHSRYLPNKELKEKDQRESSLAFNWFFNGHKNKLTSEIGRFHYTDTENMEPAREWRFRLQWDITL